MQSPGAIAHTGRDDRRPVGLGRSSSAFGRLWPDPPLGLVEAQGTAQPGTELRRGRDACINASRAISCVSSRAPARSTPAME
jgi:hypothetical protein